MSIMEAILKPNYTETVLYQNGSTEDIVNALLKEAKTAAVFTQKFASRFSKDKAGMQDLWNFVKENIPYVEDPPGVQWIQTPARLWSNRKRELGGTGKGGDCKSFTLFIISVLQNLDIDYTIRFVGYNKNDNLTHVYPLAHINGKTIIVDAVWTKFDQEKLFTFKQDYNMTQIVRLAGVGSAAVGKIVTAKDAADFEKQAEYHKGKYVTPIGEANGNPNKAMLYTYMFIQQGHFATPLGAEIGRKKRAAFQQVADRSFYLNMDNSAHQEGIRRALVQTLKMDPEIWWIERLRSYIQLSEAGIQALNKYYGKEIVKPQTVVDANPLNRGNINLQKKGVGATNDYNYLYKPSNGIRGAADGVLDTKGLQDALMSGVKAEGKTMTEKAAEILNKIDFQSALDKEKAKNQLTDTIVGSTVGICGALGPATGGISLIIGAIIAAGYAIYKLFKQKKTGEDESLKEGDIMSQADFNEAVDKAIKDADNKQNGGSNNWIMPVAFAAGAYFLLKDK